jgi:hypothetical protein
MRLLLAGLQLACGFDAQAQSNGVTSILDAAEDLILDTLKPISLHATPRHNASKEVAADAAAVHGFASLLAGRHGCTIYVMLRMPSANLRAMNFCC